MTLIYKKRLGVFVIHHAIVELKLTQQWHDDLQKRPKNA